MHAPTATSDSVTDKPPRPGWRIPLSLWMLVVVLALAATWSGVRIYREQAAIQEIHRLGGLIVKQDGGPGWLRYLVGDRWMEPFDVVEKIYLDDSTLDDAALSRLKVFTDLKILSIYETRVTDAGVAELRRDLPNVDIGR